MDTYSQSGVDYEVLDAAKREALSAARATSAQLKKHGAVAVEASRGEPAFVFERAGAKLAFVLETLGTKSLITGQYEAERGINRFADIAYDTVAAVVNDLICVGSLPMVVNAYFSTGSSSWYSKPERVLELTKGWARACEDSSATWGGGESPTLKGLVADGEIELGGSAIGYVPEGRDAIVGQDLAPGDEIVLVESSGLHTNGASLARTVASGLADGWAHRLPSGNEFGSAVLTPSHIYVCLMSKILEAGLPVSYVSHITGHGLRKLMRADAELTYRLHELLPVPEVLEFMCKALEMDDSESYGTFNMGVGLAVYCRPKVAKEICELSAECGFKAVRAGTVEAGERSVVLEPVGVTYRSEDLNLR